MEVKKTDTLAETLKKCFADTTVNPNCFKEVRLRAYDPKLKVSLQIFEDSQKTLMEMGIHSHFIFKLEAAPFEEFNEDWQFLRVVSYDQAIGVEEFEDNLDLAELD